MDFWLNDSFFLYYFQDFRLLFHKCALLHSQSRMNEFLDAGIKMFRLFFIDVYYIKDLTGLWKIACLCFFLFRLYKNRSYRHLWYICHFVLEDMALKSSRFRRELMQKEALEQEESRSRASKIFFSKLSYFLTCLRFYEKVYNVIMTTSLSHHASLLWRKRDSVIIVTPNCLHGGNVTL